MKQNQSKEKEQKVGQHIATTLLNITPMQTHLVDLDLFVTMVQRFQLLLDR